MTGAEARAVLDRLGVLHEVEAHGRDLASQGFSPEQVARLRLIMFAHGRPAADQH